MTRVLDSHRGVRVDLSHVFRGASGFSSGTKALSVPTKELFLNMFSNGGETSLFTGAAREALSLFQGVAAALVYKAQGNYYQLEAKLGSLLAEQVRGIGSEGGILYSAAEADEAKNANPLFLGTIYIPDVRRGTISLVLDREKTSFPPGLAIPQGDILVKDFDRIDAFSQVSPLDMSTLRGIKSIAVAPLLDGERRRGVGAVVLVGRSERFLDSRGEKSVRLKALVDFAENLSAAYRQILRQSRSMPKIP